VLLAAASIDSRRMVGRSVRRSQRFAIGDGTVHVSSDEQDRRDSESLYRTLEKEVVPLYYERDEHDVPRGWVFRMKRAIQTLGWRFNTDRMVMDYTRECYMPAAGASICSMPK
jgi:starch phosphorylase